MALPSALDEIIGIWRALPRKAGALLPCRRALNPRDLARALPRVALMQRRERYDIQVGMVETPFDAHWSEGMAGFNAFDIADSDMRENIARFCDAILSQPAGAWVEEKVEAMGGGEATVSTLYLPLTDRQDRATYIMGCSVSDRPAAHRSLREKLVPTPSAIAAVRFFDIGRGKPSVAFEPMTRLARSASLKERFLDPAAPTGASV